MLYTDYSHHAPALAANLAALREHFPDKKLLAIFQPHQARRVVNGWDTFADVLRNFDETIIYKLFTAREQLADFDFETIVDRTPQSFDELGELFAEHCQGSYVTNFGAIQARLSELKSDTVAIIFSAGDIDELVRESLG